MGGKDLPMISWKRRRRDSSVSAVHSLPWLKITSPIINKRYAVDFVALAFSFSKMGGDPFFKIETEETYKIDFSSPSIPS